MLISSHRHTPEDLVLWAEYEEADRLHGVGKKPQKAIEVIRAFGGCYCATSWGKDSVVVTELSMRADPRIPVVNLRVVDVRNPHCDDVRDAMLSRWPRMNYLEVDVSYRGIDRSILADDYDRQTDKRWSAGFQQAKKVSGSGRHISGVRSAESMGRRIRMAVWGESSRNACAPIGRWSTQDVFSFLSQNDLPVHPNYAMLGGGRWNRENLRVAEIGDSHGRGLGRAEWEREYYPEVLARIAARRQG